MLFNLSRFSWTHSPLSILKNTNLYLSKSSRNQLSLFKSPNTFVNKAKKTRTRNYSNRLYEELESQATSDIKEIERKLNANKTENILIYTCNTKGNLKINIMGVVGCLLFWACAYNSYVIFGSLSNTDNKKTDEEGGFLQKITNVIRTKYFKLASCGAITIIGTLLFATAIAVTMRIVNKMYLLKGSTSIAVITDGMFGKQFTYKLKLNDTSFKGNRIERIPFITFKNKNHYFYFRMSNLSDAVFHEKLLFDRIVNGRRQL